MPTEKTTAKINELKSHLERFQYVEAGLVPPDYLVNADQHSKKYLFSFVAEENWPPKIKIVYRDLQSFINHLQQLDEISQGVLLTREMDIVRYTLKMVPILGRSIQAATKIDPKTDDKASLRCAHYAQLLKKLSPEAINSAVTTCLYENREELPDALQQCIREPSAIKPEEVADYYAEIEAVATSLSEEYEDAIEKMKCMDHAAFEAYARVGAFIDDLRSKSNSSEPVSLDDIHSTIERAIHALEKFGSVTRGKTKEIFGDPEDTLTSDPEAVPLGQVGKKTPSVGEKLFEDLEKTLGVAGFAYLGSFLHDNRLPESEENNAFREFIKQVLQDIDQKDKIACLYGMSSFVSGLKPGPVRDRELKPQPVRKREPKPQPVEKREPSFFDRLFGVNKAQPNPTKPTSNTPSMKR